METSSHHNGDEDKGCLFVNSRNQHGGQASEINLASVVKHEQLVGECSHQNGQPKTVSMEGRELDFVRAVVQSFLEIFYARYDNQSSRKNVAVAYHENATFSMSSCFLSNHSQYHLDSYLPESRNLLLSNQNQNRSFLRRGRKEIVQFLNKLPMSKHDFDSFEIDVPFSNSQMIQIAVNGVFVENFHKTKLQLVFRSFSRAFILVPVENGWLVLSDILFVTAVTNKQFQILSKRFSVIKPSWKSLKRKRSIDNSDKVVLKESTFGFEQLFLYERPNFNHPVKLDWLATSSLYQPYPVQNSPSPLFSNVSFSMNPVGDAIATSDNKLAMIKLLSNESKMNTEWTIKCLKENDWDYGKAIMNFSVNKANIPPEAFQQQNSAPLAAVVSSESNSQLPNAFPELGTAEAAFITSLISGNVNNQLLAQVSLDSVGANISSDDMVAMIKLFSNESKMNNEWTIKYLKENNWDYAKAILNFSATRANIPPEAFQQQNVNAAAVSSESNSQLLNASFPEPDIAEETFLARMIFGNVDQLSAQVPLNLVSGANISSADKETMIKLFSNESKMNNEWTIKCLMENDWDYIKACLDFLEKRRNIPPEAFLHQQVITKTEPGEFLPK